MSTAPIADKIPHITTIHGINRQDDYRWLQNPEDQKVLDYLTAENTYTEAWFDGTRPLEDKLNDEIISYINEDFEDVPYPQGTYLYGKRTQKGLQYPILYRLKDGVETIYMDINKLAEGEKFFQLGSHTVSPDESMLAFSTDTVGFRQFKLYIKNLNTGAIVGPLAEKTGSVAWASDNRTLFYSVEDSAKRMYRIYRHMLGQLSENDVLVFEETDERFSVGVGDSLDRSMLFIVSDSHTTSEWHYIHSHTPAAELRMIFPRLQDIEYNAELHGDNFIIRINDKGNNFRLVSTPVAQPDLATATEIVPVREGISLSDQSVFADYYVLHERSDALPKLRVLPLNGDASYLVDFPEPAYAMHGSANRMYKTGIYRYSYTSLVSPNGTYELDLKTGKSTLLKEQTPPGPYSKDNYKSERIFATAPDGTKIPVSLVYRKDRYVKGQNPVHLLGYGSYGITMPPSFRASRVPLLDRGFVCALAHIRGGGEYGKDWHDAGKMENKMNTFTDFIAVTEHLVKEGYAASDKVIAEGGSAGGLLMGAVCNLRPDLYRAILSHVPFVDVLNTMLDDSLPLTVGEYEEWGNPNEREDFNRMLAYSPYDNLEQKEYPTIFVRTSLHDSQVMYWEPAKYVAKLRTLKTDSNPLLLLTNMNAGHGGSSGRYDAIREVAQELTFMLKILSISEEA